MYDIVPDLLTAYYLSLGAAILVGAVIGGGIVYTWCRRTMRTAAEREPPASPVVYDSMQEEDSDDDVAMRLLNQCDL